MPPEETEVAGARLLERFPGGFEEIEDAFGRELVVYTDECGEAALRDLFEGVTSERVEPGWEDRWRAFHRPVRVAGLWIGPPWETPLPGEPAVVVDPGRAFGTGAHATTRACLELLATLERGSVLDAGCGSGVLAVAAARLGFDPVHAVDLDAVAVEVARETARLNGVVVDVRRADVLRDELPATDVLVANIELRAVSELLARSSAAVAIASGYLAHERPDTKGWSAVARTEVEGWAADVFAAAH